MTPVVLRTVTTLFLAFGCRAAPAEEPNLPASEPSCEGATEPRPSPPAWQTIGYTVEGRPIELARLGDGGTVVLVLASIHGDEAAGTPLLRELVRELGEAPHWIRERTVLVVPELNVDGVVRESRRNARGVDLNRNFPAENWRPAPQRGPEPLSEPESRVLAELIERERPARVLTLHQAANQLDYDGPAVDLARAMAACTTLPVERLGSRSGSLGSWLGVDRGVPIVTVELPASASRISPGESWGLYGDLLLAGIRFPEPHARSQEDPDDRGESVDQTP